MSDETHSTTTGTENSVETFKCGHPRSPENTSIQSNGRQPVSRCKECLRRRSTEWRRRNGAKERRIGCSAHGYYPSHECKWCRLEYKQKKRLEAGGRFRVYGSCYKHGMFWPKKTCPVCQKEYDKDYWARKSKIRANIGRYAEWEREQVGKSDADQILLDRAVREMSHRTRAQEALDRLNAALKLNGPTRCKDDLSYSDYEVAPTADQAEAMCDGCPLKDLCLDYGRAARTEYRNTTGYVLKGIYGGKRIEYYRPGRIVE